MAFNEAGSPVPPQDTATNSDEEEVRGNNWSLEMIPHDEIELAAEKMVEIQNQVYLEGLQESVETFIEKIKQYPRGVYLVREIDKKVIGYVISHPGSYCSLHSVGEEVTLEEPDTEDYYIHDLSILLAKRGIGKKIMTEIENRARTDGFKTVHFVAVQGSEKIWKKIGYVVEEKIEDYSGNGDVGFKMKKAL